jgi:secreted trypsin-like serine protease
MMKSKHIALVLGAIAVTACTAQSESTGTSSSSIIGGAHDSGDPAVVLVNADSGDGSGWWCTGTVIAKRVVLTAAHCVEDATSATRFQILFGSDPIEGQPTAAVDVVAFHHDPQYMATNNIAAGHDAAVLILANDAPATPLAINTSPLDQSMVGSSVYVVGYGNNDGQSGTGAGTKRSLQTKLSGLEQGVVDIGGTGQTTCQGDSGGPTFMDVNGKNVIIGITSYGDFGCTSYGSSTRVDLSASFIQPFIDANGGSGGSSGGSSGSSGGTSDAGGGNDSSTDAGKTDAGTDSGGGTVNPACVYKCSDYGYSLGQCYQGWYCIPDGEDEGCLGQTDC